MSICPYPILAQKPGLFPSSYSIPKASIKEPQLLVVTDTYFNVPIPLTDGRVHKSRVSAEELATSIVGDHLRSVLSADGTVHPGLFFIEGEVTLKELKEKHAPALKQAVEKQLKWYNKVIQTADNAWAKNRSHLEISSIQRAIAKELDLKKEWAEIDLAEQLSNETKECPFCYSVIHIKATICPVCKSVIKKEG